MLNEFSNWLGMSSLHPLPPSKSQQKLADVLADRHDDREPAANGAAAADTTNNLEQKLYGALSIVFATPRVTRIRVTPHRVVYTASLIIPSAMQYLTPNYSPILSCRNIPSPKPQP